MVCPNCGKQMHQSYVTIYTYPGTNHVFCDCGCVLDVCEARVKLCFQANLTDEQKERVNAILASGKNLSFIATGEDQIG